MVPRAEAVINASPMETAVTTPVAETLATAAFEDCHVTASPVIAAPLPSMGVAVNARLRPTAKPAIAGVSVMEATGGMTMMVADPTLPSLVAMIVAVPAAIPVMMPVSEEMVAMVGLEVLQVTCRPVSRFPAASRRVAVAFTV